MKYSLAIIALLGLSSTVEGVKVQHHHHHHHHHDDNLVGLAGDAVASPAAAAPKAVAKAEAPKAAAAAPAAPAAAKPAAAGKAKEEPPKSDPPPENKARTTFIKEEAKGPEKKMGYGKPEVKQKKCKKGTGPMDAFDNCP